ncbi:related to FRE6-Ferric reductase [Sporisorium reilianum SRZ2]|uniref:Related to FRE6-Ferric reductase n=1 Tax=Sporisorium reilianum (strain SRZ2) TaxID=999809 RepID=E6ZSM0_SPORE|nr:related to FRE6-Ferric reductase [Sporisorium reilianum SRZ2]
MITAPWVLDSYALEHIANLPPDQTEYGWPTFRHYYYNSYKVPCVATFLIWGLFLTLCLMSGLSAFVERFFPCLHHAISKRSAWWRGHISEHALVSEKHSQVVSCGKGCFSWLTFHLPLRLEAIILVTMVIFNIVPLVSFYSLYVGHNTYFTGTDSVSRRSQILRHLANRCAMLGIGQLPMLILLASKRTPVALLSQLSMHTMILFHRWIARMCYLHIVIHTLGNVLIFHYSFGIAKGLKIQAVQWGIVAIIMLSGLVFLSLRTLRNRHYEVFVLLHISMAVLMIVFTYLHIKLLHQGRLGLQIFVIELTAGFYAFDRAVRILGRIIMSLSWRYADGAGATRKAELTSYGEGAYTRLRIQVPASRLRLAPSPSSSSSSSYFDLEDEGKQPKHRISDSLRDSATLGVARIGAGDDIRITIPKLQWVGDHPFSVFAVGRCKSGSPDMGYVDLVIQRQAGLTQKLSKLAQELSSPTITDDRRPSDMYLRHAVRTKGKRVRVVIDGPFGRSPSLEGTQHAVLVAGGIAITFCYPLLVKAARGEFSSLETCKLVWIVRNESILDVLRDSLPELLDELRRRGGSRCQLSIDIYVTSKAKSPASTLSEFPMDEKVKRLPSRLEPTWNVASGWSPERSFSSSATLVNSAATSAASSVKHGHTKVQVWDGIGYRQQHELDLMPTLSKADPIYQLSPHSLACMSDSRRKGSVSVSFENRFSPNISQTTFSQTNLDAPQPSFDDFSPSPSSPAFKRSGRRPRPFLPSTYSSHDISSVPVDHPKPVRSHHHREPEEVLLLNYRLQRDAKDGAYTPKSLYSDSFSSSPYHAFKFDSSASSNVSVNKLQPLNSKSSHSSVDSVYSVLQSDYHPSAYPSPTYSPGQDEFQRKLSNSQDVLAETKGNALMEIRRFQGRPTSMAAVHQHITQHAEREDSGRIVFATCGPAPMCDSVRAEVVALLKRGVDAALVEDCFNW